MAAKLSSFRYSLAEKRERERLLSHKGNYSSLGFLNVHGIDDDDHDGGGQRSCCSWRSMCDGVSGFVENVREVSINAWQMGKSDPRKFVFAAKMGLALMIVALLIFLKSLLKGLVNILFGLFLLLWSYSNSASEQLLAKASTAA